MARQQPFELKVGARARWCAALTLLWLIGAICDCLWCRARDPGLSPTRSARTADGRIETARPMMCGAVLVRVQAFS